MHVLCVFRQINSLVPGLKFVCQTCFCLQKTLSVLLEYKKKNIGRNRSLITIFTLFCILPYMMKIIKTNKNLNNKNDHLDKIHKEVNFFSSCQGFKLVIALKRGFCVSSVVFELKLKKIERN